MIVTMIEDQLMVLSLISYSQRITKLLRRYPP